jgi:FkbM family methyltransferase
VNPLQRNLHLKSPKLRHPFRALAGYLLQLSGYSENLLLSRNGYNLPFFRKSNLALTIWSVPDWIDPAEQFASAWLRAGDIVVDAGANIGTFAATSALHVGPMGRVLAFEPHPETFSALMRTIQLNSHLKVDCHDTALSDRSGSARISNIGRKDDCNHLVEEFGDGHDVSVTKLAELMARENLSRIDLLKIDVEGHELSVLKGLEPFEEKVACIHIEILPQTLDRFGSKVSDITVWLREAGFDLYRFAGDKDNLIAINKSATVDRSHLDLEPF